MKKVIVALALVGCLCSTSAFALIVGVHNGTVYSPSDPVSMSHAFGEVSTSSTALPAFDFQSFLALLQSFGF